MKPPARVRIAVYVVLYFALITLAPLPDRLILFPSTTPLDAGAVLHPYQVSAILAEAPASGRYAAPS